jgi:riboflavin synthase
MMFSGIVETKVHLLEWSPVDHSARIKIQRPSYFKDLSQGDSIAINGVCLTLEAFDHHANEKNESDGYLQFFLGEETLKVTGWNEQSFREKGLNIERSLRLSDRVHGHFVLGHVDGMGRISRYERVGENWLINVILPSSLRPLVWRKGSVAINGISLTVNGVRDLSVDEGGVEIELCIIPETARRTNISQLGVGECVTVEADQYARALHRFSEAQS